MTILDGNAPGPDGRGDYVDGNADALILNSLGILWTGTDGSRWDMAGGLVRASVGGIKGFGMPDPVFQVSKNAGRDGQRLRGVQRNPRTVFVPVRFKDEASTDVLGVQRQFWRSLGLGEYGTITVTTPDGDERMLRCRFEDDGGYAYTLDPFTAHVTTIGLTFTADDPYWYGDRIGTSYSLDPSAQVNFFGGGDPSVTNSGPPFVISASTGTQSYTIDNPGDVDAWPTWAIAGPATSFQVGVAGRLIAASYAIPAGRTLVIDTDPESQSAILVDTDPYNRDGSMSNPVRLRFQAFTALNFAPIPRGQSVLLTMTINGAGVVGAWINPRYERAF